MLEEGTAPDFIIVDGAEGGTGAAPLEYADHVGTPLTEGLMTVHNALVGAGLRDQVKIGASGKVATGVDIVKRLVQGADYTNAARAMMMAVGCIQAQSCHTNTLPGRRRHAGPGRARALDVDDKTATRAALPAGDGAGGGAASWPRWGSTIPAKLAPRQLMRRVGRAHDAQLRRALRLARAGRAARGDPRESWAADWHRARRGPFA